MRESLGHQADSFKKLHNQLPLDRLSGESFIRAFLNEIVILLSWKNSPNHHRLAQRTTRRLLALSSSAALAQMAVRLWVD